MHLLENNINNQIREELNSLAKTSDTVYHWEKYAKVFLQYIKTVNKETNWADLELGELANLMDNIESMIDGVNVVYAEVMRNCGAIMLAKIRTIYNKLVSESNRNLDVIIL